MLFRTAKFAALAATASLAAAPLAAAELPRIAAPAAIAAAGAFDADAVNAQNHRRWYGRNRVDAGDVIGGLLVIGTIAAVASAASKASRNGRYRDRDYRYPDSRYPDARYDNRYRTSDSRYGDSRYGESRGIDGAVDMCSREVERNARIDTVDQAERRGDGWHVAGRLRTGEPFTCSIGNDGRIQGIDYGRGVTPIGAATDGQWDDDRYAAARQAQDAAAAPAYPGGPVEGEGYEFVQAPEGE